MEIRKPKKYIQIKLYEEHSELIKFLSHHKTESIIFMMQFFQKMYEKSDAKEIVSTEIVATNFILNISDVTAIWKGNTFLHKFYKDTF